MSSCGNGVAIAASLLKEVSTARHSFFRKVCPQSAAGCATLLFFLTLQVVYCFKGFHFSRLCSIDTLLCAGSVLRYSFLASILGGLFTPVSELLEQSVPKLEPRCLISVLLSACERHQNLILQSIALNL